MNKKGFIVLLWLLACIFWIVFWLVKWFKNIWRSELTQLVDRYREIQDEYKVKEEEMNKLHLEADEIREIALEKYGVVFTEAWREMIK